jgi:1,4-dihydroxy-6-naphthoate synthase
LNEHTSIAVPGLKTTANLLLTIIYPEVKNKKALIFSEIEESVIENQVDAGLLIHEGRFTYRSKGLKLLVDLGELWESRMNCPLPLGCIAASRKLPHSDIAAADKFIKDSILYASHNPESSKDYIMHHAREMSPDVVSSHISLYVNNFSVDLGEIGRMAIETLLDRGAKSGLIKKPQLPIFLNDLI